MEIGDRKLEVGNDSAPQKDVENFHSCFSSNWIEWGIIFELLTSEWRVCFFGSRCIQAAFNEVTRSFGWWRMILLCGILKVILLSGILTGVFGTSDQSRNQRKRLTLIWLDHIVNCRYERLFLGFWSAWSQVLIIEAIKQDSWSGGKVMRGPQLHNYLCFLFLEKGERGEWIV